jgi:hypothetical protein
MRVVDKTSVRHEALILEVVEGNRGRVVISHIDHEKEIIRMSLCRILAIFIRCDWVARGVADVFTFPIARPQCNSAVFLWACFWQCNVIAFDHNFNLIGKTQRVVDFD